ncbi:MAG TPA: hypothetical protein VL523_08760 [Terriglobia bacterium]|nr:hypothetical protein [Terriglobia bacterium]
MDDLHDAIAQLARSLESLELRVHALEHPLQMQPPVPARAASPAAAAHAAAAVPDTQGAGVFSVLGKSMLGIAGAYLLRALAESATFPREAVVAIAIAYAAMWLVAATRLAAEAWFESIAYASTSAVILIPMLWELTLRFGFLPTALTAGVLGAFVIFASVLAWNRHFAAVASMAHASGSVAALVLAISTHDLAPFIVALLAMAAVSEYCAARHHGLRVRALVAAAADVAVFALIYTYSSPANAHPDYKPISGALLPAYGLVLLVIYGASANAQTMLRRRPITFFETTQALIAFLLAAWGTLSFWPGAGATVLGILCLTSSAAGYPATFACFGDTRERLNYHVYTTGTVALFLAGSYISLPPVWLPVCLSTAAIVATLLGVRTKRLTLVFHGLAYLAAAAFSSGLLAYAFRAIAGRFPPSPPWIVLTVSLCAVLCYAAAGRMRGEQWWHRCLYLFSLALAVCVAAALVVWVLVRVTAAGTIPAASHIAVIRTLTICAIALGLAYSASRWQRMEMLWMAYATLAFVASKLLFEDLRHGHLGFTAASIFLYAVTLLLVPRLARRSPRAREAGQVGLKFAASAAHPPR